MGDRKNTIFKYVDNNDMEGLVQLLVQGNINPDVVDDRGYSPLQIAAYKGSVEFTDILIRLGADVNTKHVDNGCSALHYAVCSGNEEVCKMLLLSGSDRFDRNIYGCSPHDIGLIFGHHACVATLITFIPKISLEYFTTYRSPHIPNIVPFLVEPLHKFVLCLNIHPVRIALNIRKATILSEHLDDIRDILELLRDAEMNKGQQNNEMLALKLHHIAHTLTEIIKFGKIQLAAQKEEIRPDPVELFAISMLKVERGPFPELQETFFRECVMKFPYKNSAIFNYVSPNIENDRRPISAYGVLASIINGHQHLKGSLWNYCVACDEPGAAKLCLLCKKVYYCSKMCQRLHWFVHRHECIQQQPVIIPTYPNISDGDPAND